MSGRDRSASMSVRGCAACGGKRRTRIVQTYNLPTTRDAVMEFTKAFANKAGWNEPSIDVYPNTLAPIVRVGADGKREIASATWGMPTPPAYIKSNYDPCVTNIRNVNSPIGNAGWDRRAVASCPSPRLPNLTRRARCRAARCPMHGSRATTIGR